MVKPGWRWVMDSVGPSVVWPWACLFLSTLAIVAYCGIGIFLSRVIVAFCLNLNWVGPFLLPLVLLHSAISLHCVFFRLFTSCFFLSLFICSCCSWITDIEMWRGNPPSTAKMLLALNIKAVDSGNRTLQGSGVNTVYQHWKQNWESQAQEVYSSQKLKQARFPKNGNIWQKILIGSGNLTEEQMLKKFVANFCLGMSWSAIDSWLGIIVYSEVQVNHASSIEKLKHTKLKWAGMSSFHQGLALFISR